MKVILEVAGWRKIVDTNRGNVVYGDGFDVRIEAPISNLCEISKLRMKKDAVVPHYRLIFKGLYNNGLPIFSDG